MKVINWALEFLGRSVYGGLVPVRESAGASQFLVILFKEAPLRVFLSYFAVAAFVFFSPLLFLYLPVIFPILSQRQKDECWKRMSQSQFYYFRLAAFAAKGHALMAVMSHEDAREELL